MNGLRFSLGGVVLTGAVVLAMPRLSARADATHADAGAPRAEVPVADPDAAESASCLAALRDRGVAFAVEPPTKGVRTPLRLAGPTLGALRLVARDAKPGAPMPVMDCELARALLEATPLFQASHVRDLIFSGMYQYRTRRGSSKLSEHAHGLAIDVHQFVTTDGKLYDVRRDFEQGVGEWPKEGVRDLVACVGSPEMPAARTLRELACTLRASSGFREIITADDNTDHEDHFHIEAFPDAVTRARALLARREPASDD
ncbi:MAG TPA: extensin family protein [Polyangia bacterium]|nr:extensin family protein [Polyangia bacterium]